MIVLKHFTRIAFLTILLSLINSCSTDNEEYLEKSTRLCSTWSSLECITFRNENNSNEKSIYIAEVFKYSSQPFERIKFLNGWSDEITIESNTPAPKDGIFSIAINGFLPEEFGSEDFDYTFSESDCAAQIRDGENNGAICTKIPRKYMSFTKGDIKVFLFNIDNQISLKEFVEMNALPDDTTLSSRIEFDRFYKIGQR